MADPRNEDTTALEALINITLSQLELGQKNRKLYNNITLSQLELGQKNRKLYNNIAIYETLTLTR